MVQSVGIVLTGGQGMAAVTHEVPAPSGRQVLIQTHAVGLCGSDLALFHGTYEGPKNYPLYFGHEWSGTVTAVGPDVTRVHAGDKVTGDCSIFCGECEWCARDKNLCKHIEKFGITIDGASRRYFLQDERYVYRAEPQADLDCVALSEPLAVGAHAARRVREARPELPGEKILVLGGGTIGLSCFFALKYIEGCDHVELFDVVADRVQKACGLGASEPTDVCGAKGSAQAAKGDAESYGGMYSGRGYDAIFETTAQAVAFNRAVDLLRPLGTVMALGFIPKVEVALKQITFKAAQVMGSIGGTGDFERALDFTARYPDLAREIISHRLPYTDCRQAFETAMDRTKAMKVLVQF